MQYAIAHRSHVTNDIEIVRADGSVLYVQNDVEPLYDRDGKVCGCVSVCVDMTERKHIEDVLREAARQHPGLEFEQEQVFACPPLSDANNGPLLRTVQSALAGLGLPTEAMGVPYATDAGDLDRAGIPAIVLGPGDIAQAHTADEWISLRSLDRATDLLTAFLRSLA